MFELLLEMVGEWPAVDALVDLGPILGELAEVDIAAELALDADGGIQ